jgi:lactoylglutathione lyase
MAKSPYIVKRQLVEETAPPMRIEHAAIWTTDLERLREFYERYFDCRAGERYDGECGFRSYFLEFTEGARLELMQMPSIPASRDDPVTQATGLAHLAVSLGSKRAVDALARTLAEDGHRVPDDPRRTGDGYYEAVVLDPDGNRVELTV